MTEVLSHEEFERLVKEQHGDLMPRPALIQAHEVEELLNDDWDQPKMAALKVLTLNVSAPTMYTDKKGQVIVVLPHGGLSYDMIEGFFPVKKAWLYTQSATVGAELDEQNYYFRNGKDEEDGNVPIPTFRLADTNTH